MIPLATAVADRLSPATEHYGYTPTKVATPSFSKKSPTRTSRVPYNQVLSIAY